MKNIIKIGFIFFLFLIYIYRIVFKITPISSKWFLYILGVLFSIPIIISGKYRLKKEYTNILRLCLIVFLWDIVVCSLNMQLEMYLTKSFVSVVLSLFAANLLYEVSKSIIRSNTDFLNMVVFTIAFQSLYALAMKFIPPLYAFADSVQVFLIPRDSVGDDIELMTRFIGVGTATYFAALLPCSLGLMTSVLLANCTKGFFRIAAYMVAYLLTALFTFLTARTAVVLIVLSLLFLILYQKKHNLSRIILVPFILAIIASVAYIFMTTYLDANTIEWALAVFDEKDSGSGGQVRNWWLNTEFSFKTLLIGDGRYSDGELLYYKRIDIGVHRKIFYGGLMGLFLDLLLHWKILTQIRKYDRSWEVKLFTISMFLSYVIIICKGDTNMTSLFILYLVFYSKGIFEKNTKYCQPQILKSNITNE